LDFWAGARFGSRRHGAWQFDRFVFLHEFIYDDPGHTVKADLEHAFVFENGRLRRVLDGKGSKSRNISGEAW
jgi:hypothetical protein